MAGSHRNGSTGCNTYRELRQLRANLFPAAIARAGRLAGSTGVALTSLLGYTGFLLGPPAIGFLASQAGLRTGLTTLSFLGLAAAGIAYLSRDQAPLS